MTAVDIAIQKRAVHIMTDGLSYTKEGNVVEVSPKCWSLPALNAAIACMGPALGNIVMAAEFTRRFSSFDQMIVGLEDAMPKIFAANLSLLSGSGISDLKVYIAGWSESRDRPEAYSMKCIVADSEEYWATVNERQKAEYGEAAVVQNEPFKLVQLDDSTIDPPFAAGLSAADTGFKLPKGGSFADSIVPEIDMVVMLQMQRLREEPLRPGLPPSSKVGGHALLTTIDKAGIHQRVVYRWENDIVGQPIKPEHGIDWKAFRKGLRRQFWKRRGW